MRTGSSRAAMPALALVAVLASGCTAPPPEGNAAAVPTGSAPGPGAVDTRVSATTPTPVAPTTPTPVPAATPTPVPSGDAAVPDRPPNTSAVPADLLRRTRADLDARLAAAKLQAGAVRVLVAEPVTWNDGSLGCPRPGVMYTMALVPGYRVVYGVAIGGEERQYAYHAGRNGNFQYCEHPQVPTGGNPAA